MTVGDLVAARFGDEVTDRLVEPLLGGVYAGRAREISARAATPQLVALAEQGSILAQATASRAPTSRCSRASRGGVARRSTRSRGAGRTHRRAGAGAARAPGGFEVSLRSHLNQRRCRRPGDPGRADREAARRARPRGGRELAAIEYASVAVVTLAFRRRRRTALAETDASGFLVPPVDGRRIKASTFSFAKWGWVREAGDGLLLLRTSLGRHREADTLQVTDDELVARVAARSRRGDRRGRDARRHPRAALGRWPAAVRRRPPRPGRPDPAPPWREVPGLALCGAAYDGVGIPAVHRLGTPGGRRASGHRAEAARDVALLSLGGGTPGPAPSVHRNHHDLTEKAMTTPHHHPQPGPVRRDHAAPDHPTPRRDRAWALPASAPGSPGSATIVTTSMVSAVYDKDLEGNSAAIADKLTEQTGPILFAFHVVATCRAVLLIVFAAGLFRRLRDAVPADSLAPTVRLRRPARHRVILIMGTGLDTEFISSFVHGGRTSRSSTTPTRRSTTTGSAPSRGCWVLAGLAGIGALTWPPAPAAFPRWLGRRAWSRRPHPAARHLAAAVPGRLHRPDLVLVTALGFLVGDKAHRGADDQKLAHATPGPDPRWSGRVGVHNVPVLTPTDRPTAHWGVLARSLLCAVRPGGRSLDTAGARDRPRRATCAGARLAARAQRRGARRDGGLAAAARPVASGFGWLWPASASSGRSTGSRSPTSAPGSPPTTPGRG